MPGLPDRRRWCRPAVRRRAGRRNGAHAPRASAIVGPDQADDRHVRAQVGLKLHPPELLGGDEHLRPGRAEMMWLEFLAAVEVHDRHDRPRRGTPTPRTRGGFHPVRQLDRHHVAGPTPRARSRRPVGGPAISTSAKVPANGRTAECTQKPVSGLACSPSAIEIAEGFRASTTPRPRSVSSALQGFFASRARRTSVRSVMLFSDQRECQYRRRRMLDGRPGIG